MYLTFVPLNTLRVTFLLRNAQYHNKTAHNPQHGLQQWAVNSLLRTLCSQSILSTPAWINFSYLSAWQSRLRGVFEHWPMKHISTTFLPRNRRHISFVDWVTHELDCLSTGEWDFLVNSLERTKDISRIIHHSLFSNTTSHPQFKSQIFQFRCRCVAFSLNNFALFLNANNVLYEQFEHCI